jgi:hypothetical protein
MDRRHRARADLLRAVRGGLRPLVRAKPRARHCEEQRDEAIQHPKNLDCFASLAKTTWRVGFPLTRE